MTSKPSRARHDDDDDSEASPESDRSSTEDKSITTKAMTDQETVATVRDFEFSRSSLRDASERFSVQSAGTNSRATAKSIVMPLDPSILRLVSQMDDPHDDDEEEDRRRCCRSYHIFCGCCCDVRRASMVANSVYIVIVILLTIFVFVAKRMGLTTRYDDDEYREIVDGKTDGTVVRNSLGLVMASVFGLYGVRTFRKWFVLAMVCWYAIYLVWAILGSRYFSGIFAGLLIYPNLALFLALHNDKLTLDNYADTGLCCSCCSCCR